MTVRLAFRLLFWSFPSALAANLSNYIEQGISLAPQSTPIETGSGDAFASSCQSALWAWQSSSLAYGRAHPTSILSTVPRFLTGVGPSVSAESVTVLCDGYSRAVGSASVISLPQNGSETFTAPVYATYTAPMPCKIEASDCANLYRSYSSVVSTLIHDSTTLFAPPCATDQSSSISFSSRLCQNGGLRQAVGVRGSSVQLLYWPVRTAENSSYFCTQTLYSDTNASPMTIPGTRTGSGPNTFVTGTLTITSPTVALSYGGLSRIDRCGPTLDSAIITMRPEELMSIRGRRSLFDNRPFNYEDLNWMCPSPGNSSHFTVQDNQGPHCYQNIPADAYWNAAQWFDIAMYADTTDVQHWTIINDYQPYVAPVSGVWSESLTSLWGVGAYWDIDGSWDPPIALSQRASVALPTLPTSIGQPSASAATTNLNTRPFPAHFSKTLPLSTSMPQTSIASFSSQHDDSGQYASSNTQVSSSTFAYQESDHKPSSPAKSMSNGSGPSLHETAGHDVAASKQTPSTTSADSAEHSAVPGRKASLVVVESGTRPMTWESASGSRMAVTGSETLQVGGPSYTESRDVLSATPNGISMDNIGSSRSVALPPSSAALADSDLSTIESANMRGSQESNPAESASRPTSLASSSAAHSIPIRGVVVVLITSFLAGVIQSI